MSKISHKKDTDKKRHKSMFSSIVSKNSRNSVISQNRVNMSQVEERKSESLLNNISDEERSLKIMSTVSESPSPDKKASCRKSLSALSQVSLLKDSMVRDQRGSNFSKKEQPYLKKSKTFRDHRKSISNLHPRDSDDKLNTSSHSIKSARNVKSEKIDNNSNQKQTKDFLKKGSSSKLTPQVGKPGVKNGQV